MAHYEVIEGWNNDYDYGNGKVKPISAVVLPSNAIDKINTLMRELHDEGRIIRYFVEGETSDSLYEPSQEKPIFIKKRFKDLAGALEYQKIIEPYNPCYFDIKYVE